MKLNIQSVTPQRMTCAELDTFAKSHLGLRTSLDEPSNCPPPFPLDPNYKTIPESITATDGVYSDTKQKLQSAGSNVILAQGAKEYVRIEVCDDIVKSALRDVEKDTNGRATKEAMSAITQLATVSDNGLYEDLSILYYCPNVTNMENSTTDGEWIYGKSSYSNLRKMCGKWIQQFTNRYKQFPAIERLVMPSYIGSASETGDYDHASGFTEKCQIIDFGANTIALNMSNDFNTPNYVVIRNNSNVATKFAAPSVIHKFIFVPQSMVAAYKANSIWVNYSNADRIKPIGGTTWQETFAENAASRGIPASSPYADLTDEEQSWYDELFPDLYADWVAPTSD